MECPNCAKEISPDRLFCIWCDTYVTNPEAGEKASIARRFLAALIDPFLVTAALFLPGMLIGGLVGESLGMVLGVAAFLGVLYVMLRLFARGQTLGKYLLNERVVDKRSGGNPGFVRMLIRETLGKFVSGLFLSLGFFWAIWDPDSQTWHDKIAGTVVVRCSPEHARDAAVPDMA